MAGPSKIATPAGGGIQSIQDLYNLINGQSTVTSGGSSTVSGGTTTKTESGAFSQDAMNAMLKSALESSQGLASVAGGQRTAGGYSSATNRLLVNDLMTRSAAQIAQLNQTKTTTVSAPDVITSAAPKTTTVGGVTPGGVATGAGYLAALNALEKTGGMDWLKKNIFGETAAATPEAAGTAGTAIAGANESGPMVGTGGAGKPGETAVGGYDVYTPTVETPSDAYDAYVPVEEVPAPVYDAPMVGPNENVYDKLEFADGGLVGKHPMVQMADGGSVKKQLGSMIGSQSNIVIDPRKGLIGGGTGTNPDGTPIVSNTATNTGSNSVSGGGGAYDNSRGSTYSNAGMIDRTGSDSSSTQSINAGAKTIGNIGQGMQALSAISGDRTAGQFGQTLGIASAIPGLMGVTDRVTAGTATKNDLGFTSNVIGRVANITENPALRNVATLGGLAASKTPGQLAFNVADLASKGVLSKTKGIADALMSGSLSSTVNAVAAFNPMTAAYNAIAGFLDAPSLGNVANNTRAALDPNSSVQLGDVFSNMASAVVENERTNIVSDAPTSTDVQVDMANDTAAATGVDPMDALMSATDAFGTSNGSSGTYSGGESSRDYFGDRGPGGSSGDTAASEAGANASGPGLADGGYVSNLVTPGNNAGQVQGPGTTTSDSVDAKLSTEEYVLPADVVKIIGVDTLDAVVKKYHVPAEVQKLRNFART